MAKIQFCPKCGAVLIPQKDKKMVSCSCGYKSKQKPSLVIKENIKLKKEDKIEVVDKQIETLPKTDEECPIVAIIKLIIGHYKQGLGMRQKQDSLNASSVSTDGEAIANGFKLF